MIRGRGLGDWPLSILTRPLHPSLLPENGEKGRVGASAGDDRPENPPEAIEKIDSAPGKIERPALSPVDVAGRGSGGGAWAIAAVDSPRRPLILAFSPVERGEGRSPARHARSEISPQPLEIVESAPGILEAPGDAAAARGETSVSAPAEPGPAAPPAAAPADVRPEIPPQRLEKIDSAPGNGERSDAAPAAPPEFPVIRMSILTSTGLKFVNARRTPNGMVAC